MIPAFALWLWRSVPHPVLGFPTELYPVGCEGRIHYTSVGTTSLHTPLPCNHGRSEVRKVVDTKDCGMYVTILRLFAGGECLALSICTPL